MSVSEEDGGAPSRRTDWVSFKQTLQVEKLVRMLWLILNGAIKMTRRGKAKKQKNKNRTSQSTGSSL